MAKVIDETANVSFDLYDGLNETYHGVLQVREGNTKISLTNGTEGTILGT